MPRVVPRGRLLRTIVISLDPADGGSTVPRQINATIRDRLRYGPRSDYQPDLLWDLDLYARLARADAWAFIGPINWYGPSSNFKLLFDRLVCMNEWRESLTRSMRKKNTASAQALERSARWEGLSKNHLEGRSAAFFCYGDPGGADLDAEGRDRRSLLIRSGSIQRTNPTIMSEMRIRAWFGNTVQWRRGAGLALDLR